MNNFFVFIVAIKELLHHLLPKVGSTSEVILSSNTYKFPGSEPQVT